MMMLKLVTIDRVLFTNLFNSIELTSKIWFVSYFHNKNICKYYCLQDQREIVVGICYLSQNRCSASIECSFLIFQNFRRMKFGSAIVRLILQEYESVVFKISKYNRTSEYFFNAIVLEFGLFKTRSQSTIQYSNLSV
jgi:hypothetical protein